MAIATHPTPPAPTMRAIVQRVYGGADVLHVDTISRPEIGPNEILVQVHAAGIDRGTWHLMTGLPYLARLVFGLRTPNTPVPGRDLAGIVVAVGSAVSQWQPGDEVFGTGKGSFAEFAVAREDNLIRMPANLTFEQAAAVPFAGLTALQALTDVGKLTAGQHVLIVGASGGVGSFAVQIATALGAEVTGVCSTSKVDLVTSIGADHVIDYQQTDFSEEPTHYDLILDIGGNASLARLRRVLTPRGTLVIIGGEGGGRWLGGLERQLAALVTSPFVGQRLTTFTSKNISDDLRRLSTLIEAGQLTPSIERTYPLSDVPAAMAHLAAGRARGKLVISVP